MICDDISDLLIALVGGEWIAFPARRIERVLPAIPAFGEFPEPMRSKAGSDRSRRMILGLASLDGRAMPLVDLAALLETSGSIAESAPKESKNTLVVDCGPYRFGLVVDAVLGIRSDWREEESRDGAELSKDEAESDSGVEGSKAFSSMNIRIDSMSVAVIDIDALCFPMPREAA
ncbi:MAG: chemotaxis protein CheW [Ectothiorhodospiraceae bacterium AqS1]|nr:chemotaxis protein CheW [Ectothiorhodospiraceae bacterium AqS1]